MTPLTDLRKNLRTVQRGIENALEVSNANNLSDKPVFDRTRSGRRCTKDNSITGELSRDLRDALRRED